ncbi:MAG: helix-turn-helix domain-containing protein [Streptosporangiaceae bacterium]
MVQRRRLRTELRKARQDAGLTQEQVADAMDWSLSKMIRIEAGTVGISTTDLKALLDHYEVDDPDLRSQLVALARAARERSWWSVYRDVALPGVLQLIGYEAASHIIRNFETLLIPGLLQTEDYARAVVPSLEEGTTAERVDTLVEIRMRRQEQVDRDDPPLMFFILDEAAVRRLAGSRNVMRRQIHYLIEMAAKPNVTIEIVPFTVGTHPGLRGPFVIVEFPDPGDDDVLYLEARGDLIRGGISEEGEVSAHREVFEQLRRLSLGPDGSITYLRKLADEMT